MAATTISMVAELRMKTDASTIECKKALIEAEGDLEKAEEVLCMKLGSKAGKVASHTTAGGVVTATAEGTIDALIEINYGTSFVSKNDSFLVFAGSVAVLIAENNPTGITAVGTLPLSRGGFGPTAGDICVGLVGKTGENMAVRRFRRFESTQPTSYLHGTRIGMVVAFGDNEVAVKDATIQAAATKPMSLSTDDVPVELVVRERSVAEQRAAESSKPAEIAVRTVKGSVQKYLKEISLLNQSFVKNDKQAVKQTLETASTTVKVSAFYVVNGGIKRGQGDFVAKIAAQVAATKQQT